MKTESRLPWTFLFSMLLILGGGGCGHTQSKKGPAPGSQSSGGSNGASVAGVGSPGAEAEAASRGILWQGVDELKTIHFDYDSSFLKPDERALLRRNAEWLKKNPEVLVQVAGNCDQRGTVEYNLALGQRRAKAVREYYMMLGVRGRRIATISYGKERPLCQEMTEDCWSRNRRAEHRSSLPPNVSGVLGPKRRL